MTNRTGSDDSAPNDGPDDHDRVTPLPSEINRSTGQPIDPASLPVDIKELLEKPGRHLLGDIDMRIDAKGAWFHEGGKINRQKLVDLFARVLYRDDDGDFWMVTPVEMARIVVEDAPFVALEMMPSDDGDDDTVIHLRTNVGDVVPLNDEHPIRVDINHETGEPRPYITVRGRLEALIARSVFYQLVEDGEEVMIDGEAVMGVWSGDTFFPLGPAYEQENKAS